MKYIAFIRGINVGGNSIIKMSDLKKQFENLGFLNVQTFIASGNVIFEGKLKDFHKIPYQAAILNERQLKDIINNAPNSWLPKSKYNLRKYVAFLIPPLTPKEALSKVKAKEEVDFVDIGKEVLYLSTKLEGLTKSSFKDLIKTKIYKNITLRNFNTVEKVMKIIAS